MTPNTPEPPWLSVLIPVYNVERYLGDCVNSVMAQWSEGIEVLLLDDVSTDGSAALAAELCTRHAGRLRLLNHDTNRGLASARNTLLEAAGGDYVWFLDSDDILLPGAINGLRNVVDAHAPDLVLCDYRFMHEGRRSLKIRWKDTLRRTSFRGPSSGPGEDATLLARSLLEAGQLHAWSKIARREVWQRAPFPPGRRFEDIPTIPNLVAATGRWLHVPRAWVGYRVRPGSIANSPRPDSMADLARSIGELHEGFTPMARTNRRLGHALDRFCLHRLGVVARWQHETGQVLPLDMPELLARLYPQGVQAAIRHSFGWYWRQRAARVKRRFHRVGWLS